MVFPELRPEVYYSALLDKLSTQVFTKTLWNKLRQHKDPKLRQHLIKEWTHKIWMLFMIREKTITITFYRISFMAL